MISNNKVNYIKTSKVHKSNRRLQKLSIITSLFVVVSILLGGVGTIVNGMNYHKTAYADTESEFMDAAKDYGLDSSGGQENFEEVMEKTNSGGKSKYASHPDKDDDRDFGYVLWRLFSLGYMNRVDWAVPSKGFPNPDELPVPNSICDKDDPAAGTALYHNCDIPNISAEFFQGIVSLLDSSGMQDAQVQSAKVLFGFGLPSTIPENSKGEKEVPVNPSERSVKYTGLELFGYNMRYTTYLGEWDNIKVLTSARALSNFGMMDGLRLGFQSTLNGIANGLDVGLDGFVDGWKNGGPIGSLWGGVKGLIEGIVAGVVVTVLDTSDYNVYNMHAWYRADYGKTLYNGQELTQQEIQNNLLVMAMRYLEENTPDAVKPPADLMAIKTPPERPHEQISKCEIITKDDEGNDKKTIYPKNVTAPGPTKEECEKQADSVQGSYNWSVDGTHKQQSLKDWRNQSSSFFEAAEKYGITVCEIDTSTEDNRETRLNDFYNCWNSNWSASYDKVMEKEAATVLFDWFQEKFAYDALSNWLANKPEMNVNAPWNRFACVDENGDKIIKDSFENPDQSVIDKDGNHLGSLVINQYKMIYKNDGSGEINDGCKPIRPPIQDGYFGNGYEDGQGPLPDTRRSVVEEISLTKFLFDAGGQGSGFANSNMSISQFITQFTNTVLDFAFSPILDKLGIKDKIITFVEAFRNSIYLSLAYLVMAFGGVSILVNSARRRAYTQGLKSLLIMLITFFLSVVALFKTEMILNIIDEGPAYVETAIVGTIYGIGADYDPVCSATQSTADTLKGLNDEDLPFSPRSNIRTLNCQVWRAWVFDPWVSGQWGVGYDSLYANSTTKAKKMNNSNSELVGDAAVYMGGGVTENNWALYQLQTMTSGTSTTSDPDKATGNESKDIYRLVDLQAGPNGGAESDGRFFHAWSGENVTTRVIVSLINIPSVIIGAITIMSYAFTKLVVTFTSILLILFLPFILLIGLHPTSGRMQLKGYIGTLLSLMYQRIMLVTILAIMLRIIIGVSNSGGSVIINAIMVMVLSFLFLMNKRNILDLVKAQTNKTFGNSMVSQYSNDTEGSLIKSMPRSVRQFMERQKVSRQAAIGGAIGGFISGKGNFDTNELKNAKTIEERNRILERARNESGISRRFRGAVEGAKEQRGVKQLHTLRKQRREGFGALRSVKEASQHGKNYALEEYEDLRRSPHKMDSVQKAVQEKAAEIQTNEVGKRVDASQTDFGDLKLDKYNPKQIERLNRIKSIQSRLDELKSKKVEDKQDLEDISEESKDGTGERVIKQPDKVRQELLDMYDRDEKDDSPRGQKKREKKQKEIDRLTKEYDKLIDEEARYSYKYETTQGNPIKSQEINDIHESYKDLAADLDRMRSELKKAIKNIAKMRDPNATFDDEELDKAIDDAKPKRAGG